MKLIPTRHSDHPLKPERFFRAGTLARFDPPYGAYSPKSEQYRQRGKDCLVVHCWNDSHATVIFGSGAPVVVAIDYLWERMQ